VSSLVIAVERPENWPFDLPGVEVVAARRYLTDAALAARRGTRVFNLCRSYRYQSLGYYVSLLAEARGHKPLPSVATIQDLKSPSLVRYVSEDLDALIQKSLAPLLSVRFTLSIYFGKNVARRHQRLALALFNLFPAPLLRAELAIQGGRWQLQSLKPIAVQDLSQEHREFVVEAARDYFAGRRRRAAARTPTRYDLAILVDPSEELGPSDERAIQRFEDAARELALRPEHIGRDDYGRLAEFDALFIRQTTSVHHFTYRFSRRAAAEGLVVIDDPQSILRCSNKVYLAEALSRARVPTPRTLVVHRDNVDTVADELGLPAILKLADGSFSQAVARVDDRESFRAQARRFLDASDLAIAQEFLPTDFDWRVGVLDRRPLFAARYKMTPGHWQIVRHDGHGGIEYGGTEAVAVADAPPAVVEVAVTAAGLIGDGFYGVDVKDKDGRVVVIEVNDNPNVDDGCEDAVLGDELYRRVMQVFLQRIERLKEGKTAS